MLFTHTQKNKDNQREEEEQKGSVKEGASQNCTEKKLKRV